jgi:hypothetical protein
MTLLNPEHLLDQAARLAAAPPNGRPRQADLRRAISATYYAVFHAIVTDLADQLVGRDNRDTPYSLLYRGVLHRDLSGLCKEIVKDNLTDKYKLYEPEGGFSPDLLAVANAFVSLQEKRHSADYDPLYRVRASETALTLEEGRAAVAHWRNVPNEQRRLFITLLAFL